MTSEERRKHVLLQQLATLGHEKEATRKQANAKRRAEYLRKQALAEARSAPRKKEETKALYRRLKGPCRTGWCSEEAQEE